METSLRRATPGSYGLAQNAARISSTSAVGLVPGDTCLAAGTSWSDLVCGGPIVGSAGIPDRSDESGMKTNEVREEGERKVAEEFGGMLPRILITPPGTRSLEMAKRLARVESRNVTHLTPDSPVFWEEAHGANVRDVDGNIYLDLTGAFGVSAAGHTPSGVVDGLRDQAGLLIHGMGDVHPPVKKVEFLEALAGLVPWPDSRAILGSSGSEAVEAALKTALLATGRPGILAFEGAYHGLTLGSLATTHREDFRGPFLSRLYKGVRFASFPDSRAGGRTLQKNLDHVRFLLREGDGGDEIGAVIIEPIQGRAGVRIPPPGYLEALADLTWDAKAILIFDEIFTGLGRTGALFAFLHEGVVPDLLCLGKGLGGGLPLSALVGPARVMDAWPPSRGEAIHTSTFLGNPLACAAGLAFLKEMANGDLIARSQLMGKKLLGLLKKELTGIPEVNEVRGRGLFAGVELRDPRSGAPIAHAAARAAALALREGILILPAGASGHVLELSPPLVITEEQLRWMVPQLKRVIEAAVSE
jgi:4-aminobutyrate aminotransferase-like enzyme